MVNDFEYKIGITPMINELLHLTWMFKTLELKETIFFLM